MAQDDPNPNSIDNIRNILFGDQVAQIEERFNLLDQVINSLRNENRNLRQALESELTMREQAIKDLQNKINTLESDLQNKINTLEKGAESELNMREQSVNDLQKKINDLDKKTETDLQKYMTMQAELGASLLADTLEKVLKTYKEKLGITV